MTCDITICDIEIFNHSNGQDSAAREALEWLRGTNRVDQVLIVVIKIMLQWSICKGFYLQEFYQIKRSLDESSQLSAGLGDLVKRWRKFNVGADVDVDVDADVDVDVNVKMFQPKLGAVHHLADVDVRAAVERDERRHVLLRRHLPGGKNHKHCLLSLLILRRLNGMRLFILNECIMISVLVCHDVA